MIVAKSHAFTHPYTYASMLCKFKLIIIYSQNKNIKASSVMSLTGNLDSKIFTGQF